MKKIVLITVCSLFNAPIYGMLHRSADSPRRSTETLTRSMLRRSVDIPRVPFANCLIEGYEQLALQKISKFHEQLSNPETLTQRTEEVVQEYKKYVKPNVNETQLEQRIKLLREHIRIKLLNHD